MPSSARTLCVAPEQVDDVLPHVIGMINDAVQRCGDWSLHDICYLLQGAQALLWIIWDGNAISAAAVSQIIKVPKGKICQVIACGGTAESWPVAIVPIEDYGRAEGCVRMRIQGRQGWARVFPDYKTEWVSMKKELN